MAKNAPDTDTAPKIRQSVGIMTIAALSVLAASASFVTSFFSSPTSASQAESCPVAQNQDTSSPGLVREDQTYTALDDIVITVGSSPATRYVKLSIAIVSDKQGIARIEKAKPVLIDAFGNYLRSIEPSDFEDPTFYPSMKDALNHRAELVLGSSVSRGVLVTEFLLR